MKAFLDTQSVVRLRERAKNSFSPSALDLIERAFLVTSPFVRMELTLLHEIGRILAPPDRILEDVEAHFGVTESVDRLADIITASQSLQWTRDPFDRLIVATAMVHRAPLITSDRRIREHYEDAVW